MFLKLVVLLTVTCSISAQQVYPRWKRQVPPNEWNPWRSPLERFDKYTFSKKLPAYGDYVKGFSVPMYFEDQFWDPYWSEYPQWFLRRINCFLGIPYAKPPIGRRRFQRAKPPNWQGTWDATYFRPACPQDISHVQQDIPEFSKVNVSEDCLYMNIFVPNRTQPNLLPDKNIYPVIVYLHSGDFSYGTAQSQPGHVLAVQDVVVVTFNYRLGALGFLTTEDEHAPGNWGFSDQIQALDFIKRNIIAFRGDPSKITIMGDTAGGVSVGLHLVSPSSRGRGYYHQAILMSGTDLSYYGIVKPFYRPRDYAIELAKHLGCPTVDSYVMMNCLRDNSSNTWEDFVRAQQQIHPHDGALGVVWAPTQDGQYFALKTEIYLPEMPDDLRRQDLFERVPTIIGINAQDGAMIANRSVMGLGGGISTKTFREFLMKMLQDWMIIDVYQERAAEAIEFQYTFWPDPDNRTARGQEFINMITDINFGVGMDRLVKQQCDYAPTYAYVFRWRSWNEWIPWYLGASHSSIVGYVLGFPFLNDTVLNETYMVPRTFYDLDDRNISDFMMYMWSCFAKYGNPTPNITRNVSWVPFNQYNFTYLDINWHSYMWFRYRQSHFGFWNDYFPRMAKQNYFYPTATPTPGSYEYVSATGCVSSLLILLLGTMVYPTATPTPGSYEYVIATGCVSSLLILLLGTMGILIYLLWYQHQRALDAPYQHPTRQLESMPLAAGGSSFAASSQSPHSTSFMSGSTSFSDKKSLQSTKKYPPSSGMMGAQYAGGSLSSLTGASTSKMDPFGHSVV